jgi:hypothetical protein
METMDLTTGFALGALIMVVGASGLTAFAIFLAKRDGDQPEQPKQKRGGRISRPLNPPMKIMLCTPLHPRIRRPLRRVAG